MTEIDPKVKGGLARAESLSADERKEIASKAAKARWSLPQATHEGSIDLKVGDVALSIGCAILPGQRRVLTQSDFMRALGRARQAKGRAYYDGDVELPAFLTAKNLKPFISEELRVTSSQIVFRRKNGGRAFGYPAVILPKVCDVFLQARDAGVLAQQQVHIAKQAEIIIRGLAHIGIIALVDEATGFQADRARDALARILEEFIAKELQQWTKMFPLEFYEHIFRLRGWPFDPVSVKRPGVIGHYTNNIIYKRLAPGVLDELREKNPAIDGRRKHKHHQWLTGDIGHPKLKSHIDGVLAIMRASEDWEEFKKLLNRSFKIIETTDLGFDVEYEDA